MTKYKIIGNMTGNSMDAIDLVLTEFDGDKMLDICSFTKPYPQDMQQKIEYLRAQVFNKTKTEIEAMPEFQQIHDAYVTQVADCVNQMCDTFKLNKKEIDAIGFHGKTLDHNPPSKAGKDGSRPYTLQIGSGQMLADLTSVPVVYDFRSDPLLNGFDGAPLVGPHNAHISVSQGDGIYYNGGNTSNFAVVNHGAVEISADAGPFNEYTDNFIRLSTGESFDKDGAFGRNGQLDTLLLAEIFNQGRRFYETSLPKSGDPAFYHKSEIFDFVAKHHIKFDDAVRTFEYAAAYIALQALTLIADDIVLPDRIILFGGGWKNPLARQSFEALLAGNAFVLDEHRAAFDKLRARFNKIPEVISSPFGDYMEARLFADMARYKLEDRAWEIPEIVAAGKKIVCGVVAYPQALKPFSAYDDKICRAALVEGRGVPDPVSATPASL